MNKILYIDACVREASRTRVLAQTVLDQLEGEIITLRLDEEEIRPLTGKTLVERDALIADGCYEHPMFRYAHQFATADTIVMAAPYWDLSFPASVKVYMEAITVNGITFRYNEKGIPEGLCAAKELYYVTTAGGFIAELNMGKDYVAKMASVMYGISSIHCFTAEGLDIQGANVSAIMAKAQNEVISFFKSKKSEGAQNNEF